MKETILWFTKGFLNLASIIIFIICLCSMDSESLLIPTIGLLTSAAWIGYALHSMDEKEGEM